MGVPRPLSSGAPRLSRGTSISRAGGCGTGAVGGAPGMCWGRALPDEAAWREPVSRAGRAVTLSLSRASGTVGGGLRRDPQGHIQRQGPRENWSRRLTPSGRLHGAACWALRGSRKMGVGGPPWEQGRAPDPASRPPHSLGQPQTEASWRWCWGCPPPPPDPGPLGSSGSSARARGQQAEGLPAQTLTRNT